MYFQSGEATKIEEFLYYIFSVEIAEIQMKVLSLYEAPNLQFLQLLIDIPGTCQMNDSTQHPDDEAI